jgi:uncharacterized protein YdeI (YjbR/CyaY-like superfamily)
MIDRIEDYFADGCGRCARFATPECSARRWAAGLAALRALCLEAGLDEGVKWGHPCYGHAGRNLAILGAFRGDFRISFPDAALLADPEGLLRPAGPNSRAATTITLAHVDEVDARAPALRALLAEARAHAAAGRRPARVAAEVEVPEDLSAALDADPDLAEAWHALTPGRQRSYVIALASAKAPATRLAQIVRFRPAILAGRGATERPG